MRRMLKALQSRKVNAMTTIRTERTTKTAQTKGNDMTTQNDSRATASNATNRARQVRTAKGNEMINRRDSHTATALTNRNGKGVGMMKRILFAGMALASLFALSYGSYGAGDVAPPKAGWPGVDPNEIIDIPYAPNVYATTSVRAGKWIADARVDTHFDGELKLVTLIGDRQQWTGHGYTSATVNDVTSQDNGTIYVLITQSKWILEGGAELPSGTVSVNLIVVGVDINSGNLHGKIAKEVIVRNVEYGNLKAVKWGNKCEDKTAKASGVFRGVDINTGRRAGAALEVKVATYTGDCSGSGSTSPSNRPGPGNYRVK